MFENNLILQEHTRINSLSDGVVQYSIQIKFNMRSSFLCVHHFKTRVFYNNLYYSNVSTGEAVITKE